MNNMGTVGADPSEFPKIAREMGFKFSVKRGRVDWHKIDLIDIDRLIQERDLSTLKENLTNITNYNLENEYDLKILDSNFVKLFKLAQLSIDYLMYSEQHLFNCVELLREEYTSCIKECEKLRRVMHTKDNVIKSLKKKNKDLGKKKLKDSGSHQQKLYQCVYCPKAFVSADYLEAHCLRRHVACVPSTVSDLPIAPDFQESVATNLQEEIQQIKALLILSEKKNKENIVDNKIPTENYNSIATQTALETNIDSVQKNSEWEKKYLDKVIAVKSECQQDIEKLKDILDMKEKEITDLRKQFQQVQKHLLNSLEEQKKQKELQEQLWQDLSETKALYKEHKFPPNYLDTVSSQEQNRTVMVHSNETLATKNIVIPTQLSNQMISQLIKPSSSDSIVTSVRGLSTDCDITACAQIVPEPANNLSQISSSPSLITQHIHKSSALDNFKDEVEKGEDDEDDDCGGGDDDDDDNDEEEEESDISDSEKKEKDKLEDTGDKKFENKDSHIDDELNVYYTKGSELLQEPTQLLLEPPDISDVVDVPLTCSSSKVTADALRSLQHNDAPSPETVPTFQLRQHIEALGEHQLRALGVDPAWKGLPHNSFAHANQRLHHLRRKRFPVGLVRLRESLKKSVEKEAKRQIMVGREDLSLNQKVKKYEKRQGNFEVQPKAVVLDRVMDNVKKKAQALYAATGSQIRKLTGQDDTGSLGREIKSQSSSKASRENERSIHEVSVSPEFQINHLSDEESNIFKPHSFITSHPIPSRQNFPPVLHSAQLLPIKKQIQEVKQKTVCSETALHSPEIMPSNNTRVVLSDPGTAKLPCETLFPSSTEDEATLSPSPDPDRSELPEPSSEHAIHSRIEIAGTRSSLKQLGSSTSLSKKKVIFAEQNMEYCLDEDDNISSYELNTDPKHSDVESEKPESEMPLQILENSSSDDWDDSKSDSLAKSNAEEDKKSIRMDNSQGNGSSSAAKQFSGKLLANEVNVVDTIPKPLPRKRSNLYSSNSNISTPKGSTNSIYSSKGRQKEDLDTWDLEDFDT